MGMEDVVVPEAGRGDSYADSRIASWGCCCKGIKGPQDLVLVTLTLRSSAWDPRRTMGLYGAAALGRCTWEWENPLAWGGMAVVEERGEGRSCHILPVDW